MNCLGMVLSLLISNLVAEVFSGTVIDSVSGKKLARVKVGMDDTHFVWTDSAGNFVFNTEGNVGIGNRNGLNGNLITWNSGDANIQIPRNFPGLKIQLRNIEGKLIRSYSPENSSVGSKVSLPNLPMGIYSLSIRNAGKILTQRTMLINGPTQLAMNETVVSEKAGLSKSARTQAISLKFTKPTYYTSEKTFANSQNNVVIPLREDFSPTRHDFMSAAEWQCTPNCETNQKMFIVRGGKVVWTYTEPLPCEFDDAWVLSDSSIVMSLRYGARKLKSIHDPTSTWYIYENIKTQGEIHVTQPLDLNRVFVWVNEGNHNTGLIINTQTGDTLKKFDIPSGNSSFHGGGRHARFTREGTLMVAHFNLNKVAEYDTATMKEIWSYPGKAWAAVKLRNGNLLISGDGEGWVREINRATKAIDWEINLKNFPNVKFGAYVQGITRLSNGNTIITNHRGDPPILEVSPDKKIVWSVSKDIIPLSSTVQILGEEGVPENPGDLLR